jgi:carotenoid 1,2-hydratase
MSFDGRYLQVALDERSAPMRRPIKGTVRVDLQHRTETCFGLHSEGQHRWWPIAPATKVDVTLDAPELSWSGRAYMDTNGGTVPLEQTFSDWHWSRSDLGENCRVVYEAHARDGESCLLSLFGNGEAGMASEHSAPRRDLSTGPLWRVKRPARSHQGFTVQKTLEDTPFYTRSHLHDALGNSVMHESLDLDRFASPWVQRLLPFRMRKILYGFPLTGDSRVTIPFSKGLK